MDIFEKLLAKSYKFLSYRPRSEKEIRDYLKKKKADDITIERIVQSLKINKFLDDVQFTKWWIEQRSKIRPKALRIIKLELNRKGIAKDVIDAILEEKDFEYISEYDKAVELARKKVQRLKNDDPQKKFEKIARFLASRGFDWETIKEVIDQALPKEYNT